MKFSGNTKEILEGINIASRAITSRPASQVLEGLYISCEDDTLSILSSDGQMSIRWEGSVTVQEPGSAIIPGKLFSELMRRLPDTTTTITADDKTATVTYNKSRSHISVITGTFPQRAEVTDALSLSVPAITLKDMITHVLDCVSTDSTRIILTGGLLEISPDDITMVALDGFRLAIIHHQMPTNIPNTTRAIIPRKTLSELAKLLPASDTPVSIRLDSSYISFSAGTAQLTSSLLTGEYINYKQLIPQTFTTSIRISKSGLQDSIDRASIVAREGKSNLIRLDIRDYSVSVSSRSDLSTILEELDCDMQGNPISISFNSSYLTDAIRSAPDDTVSFNFTTPTSPAVIFPDSSSHDWLYLILPVRTT